MSFITKIFHKSDKKATEEAGLPPITDNTLIKQQQNVLPANVPPPSNASAADTRSGLQNGGMVVGALAASSVPGGTENPTMGMVEGLVAGNMLAQRIQQHKNHEYWRGQEARFQAGDKDAVLAAPTEGGRNRSRNREGREERRKKRWERRANRKGDGTVAAGEQSGTSSDEAKD